MPRIAIAGVAGRMGRALLSAAVDSDVVLVGATARSGSSIIGSDIGLLVGSQSLGVTVVDRVESLPSDVDVLIDFTSVDAVADHADFCRAHKAAWVVGTTGLDTVAQAIVRETAEHVAVCVAANFSTGVNLLLDLLARAATALGDKVDIEIIEAHHRHKVDAPSGTALAMGAAVADALDRDLDAVAVFGREGMTGPRERETIGFSTIRGGDVVGDHTVLFAGEGERIEISHRASSRMAFAGGAMRAAQWLSGRAAGYYDMRDVLGLREK